MKDPDILFEKDILQLEECFIPDLLLSHCCEGQNLTEIVSDKQFKTKECDVFKEELVYFFYGKPAYITEISPAFFILKKKNKLSKKVRIAPFDTGGVKGKCYDVESAKFSKLDIEAFCISLETDDNIFTIPKKIIMKYYGNNKLYFKGHFQTNYLKNSDGYKALSYFSQIYCRICADQEHSFGVSNKDPRKTTIEIQYKSNVSFDDFELVSLVCNSQFKTDTLKEKLKEVGYEKEIIAGLSVDIMDSEIVRKKAFKKMKKLQFKKAKNK